MVRHKHGLPGALVVSLDFELRWGVRDIYPVDGGAYRTSLLGGRTAIPHTLDLFRQHGVAATWATVGMLMAESRAERERYLPPIRPAYVDPGLNPYADVVGDDESADPLHYGMSLVEHIRATPNQIIGSHTFGHYYPLEAGHTEESFRADLASACEIAAARDISLKSLVFPRNQYNPRYAAAIRDAGIAVCRTNASGWMYTAASGDRYRRQDIRAGRLVDNYVPLSGHQVFRWDEISFEGSLCCLPASHFLRPYSPALRHLDALRFQRIANGIRDAARTGGVFHLWWHPHNMGVHTEAALEFLARILDVVSQERVREGLMSLSMESAAELAATHFDTERSAA